MLTPLDLSGGIIIVIIIVIAITYRRRLLSLVNIQIASHRTGDTVRRPTPVMVLWNEC